MCFGYGTVTHYGPSFQTCSPTQQLGNSVCDLVLTPLVPRPHVSNATRLGTDTV
jgi:hypothetical protein